MVTTPIPPIWISKSITICPNKLHCVAVSTVIKPVTHTADTDVNSASMYFGGEATELIGKDSSALPTSITAKNQIGMDLGDVKNFFNIVLLATCCICLCFCCRYVLYNSLRQNANFLQRM